MEGQGNPVEAHALPAPSSKSLHRAEDTPVSNGTQEIVESVGNTFVDATDNVQNINFSSCGPLLGNIVEATETRLNDESSNPGPSHGNVNSGSTSIAGSCDMNERDVSSSPPDNAPLSEMDAVLQEESQRLDKVMSPTKESCEADDKTQVLNSDEQYKRLIELLTKSQFYTEFLVKKLAEDESDSAASRKKKGGATPQKSGTQQVLAIAADIISKKSNAEAVEEDKATTEDTELNQMKTLENGLVVPLTQPKLLSGASLRDYQVEGLNWLKLLFENGVNGILADEMGLGKTIQVIALISHLVEKNVRGPFLIIGPLSTLPNWALEFERFTPEIPYILYHGPEEKRVVARRKMNQKKIVQGHKMYPVIITSYDYPLRDAKYLRKMNWRYIIIDEGHRIKNHNSLLSRALRTYESANRLLLTGTPLHNSLSELWALLNFLVPEIFDDLDIFESWFRIEDLAGDSGSEKVLEEEKKKNVLSTMHKILSPFMLRRVKAEVQLNLPPKKELVVYAPMTPIQLDLYKAVLDYNLSVLKAKEEENLVLESEDGTRLKRTCTTNKKFYNLRELFRLEDELEAGGPAVDNKMLVVKDEENKNYAIRVQMLNTSMMLRKIVNHPYLVQYPLEPDTPYARIDEDIVKTSGKLLVLDAMLTKLKERGHKVLLFSTFTTLIDIIEDYLSLRTYNYLRLDGSTSLDDRQTFIKKFNSDPNVFLFLISTRAGGLGINLAGADTVILFDSDWNPQIDLQAQDRCHRIGQTRPVVVYRFVTAGTVDERIVARAAAKRKLEKIIIHKGNYSALQKQDDAAIDLDELRKLLKYRDHHRVIHPNGFVFSDQELDDLLDRSDLISGKSFENKSSVSVQERHFKEYYGYTGTKSENNLEESCSSAQIVEGDSSDAAFVMSPVRRSPMKSSSSSNFGVEAKNDSGQTNGHRPTSKRPAEANVSVSNKMMKRDDPDEFLGEKNSRGSSPSNVASRKTRTSHRLR